MVVRFWIIIVPLQSRQEKDVFQWTQRQIKRFPLLRCRNVEILKSQNVTSSWGGDRRLPYAFTEQGIAMLSSVLKSQTAVKVNIRIISQCANWF